MRWPEGPPHLALNPPYFCFFGFFVFVFSHLALNPPCFCFFVLLFFVFFWPFLSWFLIEKTGFPPRKGHFVIFESPPLFLLSLFWPPPLSVSLSLCLSLSLSLSLALVFFFFLLVFLFCFLLVPCFCLLLCFCVFFAFVSWKNNIRRFNCNYFHQSFIFIGILSCFPFQIPFIYLCCFLISSYVFCSTWLFLVSKQTKNTNFWSKGGLQQNVLFFYEPVFCKMSKVIVFLEALFGQILGDVQKRGISVHFFAKNGHF